jgi:hypothetical protein
LKNTNGSDSMRNGKMVIKSGRDPDVPMLQGMIQSFYDAPNGFKEQIAEINPSVAVEYCYNKMISGRMGFFYEDPGKGNRRYLTIGAGGKFKGFSLDLAYILRTPNSTTITRNPLENTIRFSIGYNLEKHSN